MADKEVQYAVNLDSAVAVYVQIENQVQFAIAAGHYKVGDLVPSVREMSTNLNVNPNTITKAYRDLELLSIVNTQRGVGVTVAAKATKICKDRVIGMVEGHLKEGVLECVASGIDAKRINTLVSQAIKNGGSPYQG